MTANIANWVKQSISSDNGAGLLTLGTAANGAVTIAQAGFTNGAVVYYSIVEGYAREIGVGTYVTAGTQLQRVTAFETLASNGTYDNTSPSFLTFTSAAIVTISPSLQALTVHLPTWKRVFNTIPFGTASYGAEDPNPAAIFGNIELPYFPAVATHAVQVCLPIGHDVTENTSLYLGVHCIPDDNTAGDVYWKFEYGVADIGEIFLPTADLLLTSTIVANTANTHLLHEFANPITVGSPGSMVIGKLSRLSTAGYTGDIGLIQVSGVYQGTRLGTPGKSSNFTTW